MHKAQQTALAAAKAGVLTRAVDESARAILEQAGHGQYFTHRLGHGESYRSLTAQALDNWRGRYWSRSS